MRKERKQRMQGRKEGRKCDQTKISKINQGKKERK